jgi:hypothetical protein
MAKVSGRAVGTLSQNCDGRFRRWECVEQWFDAFYAVQRSIKLVFWTSEADAKRHARRLWERAQERTQESHSSPGAGIRSAGGARPSRLVPVKAPQESGDGTVAGQSSPTITSVVPALRRLVSKYQQDNGKELDDVFVRSVLRGERAATPEAVLLVLRAVGVTEQDMLMWRDILNAILGVASVPMVINDVPVDRSGFPWDAGTHRPGMR